MMIQTIYLKFFLVSLILKAFLHYAEASARCNPSQFTCTNGRCVPDGDFCNGRDNCGDNSDEKYCNVDPSFWCPVGWDSCPNNRRCIPSHWMCEGRIRCPNPSEEKICRAKRELNSWFMRRRKAGSRADRWGSQVHRIAVALHMANNSTFSPENSTGDGIRYEMTIQLLQRLSKDKKMSSQELALYIHGLLVSCMDPRNFYGNDLVRELRRRVDESGNYTNPFLILVLCNAEDDLTALDLERVMAAYDSQHRPFWTDSQALASMALSCISSRTGQPPDERTLKNMLQELKRQQFRNGTIDNVRTTALVTQALFIYESFKREFDFDSAIKVLIDGLNGTKSLLNAYYTLPVLYRKSLLNVSSSHCSKEPVEEDEALQKMLEDKGENIIVHYSVWMGDEVNLGRTWQLRMRINSTIYDAIETVAKIDNRQKVEYNIVGGKPYIASLNGKEDDFEMENFWFIYLKAVNSEESPKIVEESPVDVTLQPHQEIILWYKHGPWNGQRPVQTHLLSD